MAVQTRIQTELKLSFRPDIRFTSEGEGTGRLQGEQFDLPFRKLSAGLQAVIAQMCGPGATEAELKDLISQHDGPMATMFLYQYLSRLAAIVCHTVTLAGQPLATVVPLLFPSPYRFQADAAAAQAHYRLSRFAYQRRDGEMTILESPRGYAKVILHDELAGRLLHGLTAPLTAAELAEADERLDETAALAFLNLLHNGAMLEDPAESEDPALAQWDFHDLLFHSRSRLGRHNYPYGGTGRSQGIFEPLPAVKPAATAQPIPLYKPADDTPSKPLATVMAERRSIRSYSETPIAADQLGEFLYRVARVKTIFGGGPGEEELSQRPYPAGGSIYELEIYPVIGHCEGLEKGLYHYDPLQHALHKLAGESAEVKTLLQLSWFTGSRQSPPQVCLAITARFQRLQWKYESMAYALILKNVGVLMQTMYLVAADMGLAPCALGGGHSDLFAKAAGL
ncbi:MAG: SagB family peptide dehydrogenase, partial [Anaerolineales bacterium]|nr:SagB family peptide dehydrogenase [Anaerolineales bacterium]